MDYTRLMTVLCAFLLLVCLVIAIIALTVMRNAVDESQALRARAQNLLEELGDSVEAMNALEERYAESVFLPSGEDGEESQDEGLTVRAEGGRIGVYTSEGKLIRILDIDFSALPRADRERLERGISISSLRELLTLVQDYTG